jgi:4'-phosphopantetheinyl transferase
VNEASLLHAPLTPGLRLACAQRLLEALPYAARLRLERFEPTRRAAGLAGLALALTSAARALGDAFGGVADLRMPDEQKPQFARGPYFSLSHTQGHVACVSCLHDDVGLDIESSAAGSPTPELLRWTASEATLKAAGAGLRRLAGVQVDLAARETSFAGTRYVLHELHLAPGTFGHVASSRPLALAVEPVELDGAAFSASLERLLGLPPQREQ